MKLKSSSYYEYYIFGRNSKRLNCSFDSEFDEPLELEKNLITGEIKITMSSDLNLSDIEEAVLILERLEKEFYND